MKKRSLNYIFLTALTYLLQLQVYLQVHRVFNYFGFMFEPNFTSVSQSALFLLSSIPLVLFKNSNDLNSVFLKFWHLFVFVPITVLLFSGSITVNLALIHIVFLTTIKTVFLVFKKLYFKAFFIKDFNPFKPQTSWVLIIVSLLLFIPFFQVLPNFDFRSFVFTEIYSVRFEARSTENIFLSYLRAPLARVLLPMLIIIGLLTKKHLYTLTGASLILIIYASTGALKSIIAIIPLILLFVKCKSYFNVTNKLNFLLISILMIAIIENYFLNTYFVTDIPNRRLLFVPGLLENAYLIEFKNNMQFYRHSFLKFFNPESIELTKLIGGKYFGRPEMNANVGIVMDGYLNLGIFGVLLHAIIIAFSILILNTLKIKPQLMGLVLAYFYYINTSFIGTLFLTHGFLFLLLFSRFFLNNYVNKRITHLSEL